MKIEKLTENKIRIVINMEELNEKNINLSDLMGNMFKSQSFFVDILNKAEKEVGFNTNGCKLLIEAFSSLDDVFVFTITKFETKTNAKRVLKIAKKKNKYSVDYPIYSFDSFEEFCNLCDYMNKLNLPLSNIAKHISLYLYNNTYYLVFSELNLSYRHFKKLFFTISEFANLVKRPKEFNSMLAEHGKLIINKNAFKTGVKYFSKNKI